MFWWYLVGYVYLIIGGLTVVYMVAKFDYVTTGSVAEQVNLAILICIAPIVLIFGQLYEKYKR